MKLKGKYAGSLVTSPAIPDPQLILREVKKRRNTDWQVSLKKNQRGYTPFCTRSHRLSVRVWRRSKCVWGDAGYSMAAAGGSDAKESARYLSSVKQE